MDSFGEVLALFIVASLFGFITGVVLALLSVERDNK